MKKNIIIGLLLLCFLCTLGGTSTGTHSKDKYEILFEIIDSSAVITILSSTEIQYSRFMEFYNDKGVFVGSAEIFHVEPTMIKATIPDGVERLKKVVVGDDRFKVNGQDYDEFRQEMRPVEAERHRRFD